ncbi:MAG: PASTA domain-containing protein [Pseudomonadota bacterium]
MRYLVSVLLTLLMSVQFSAANATTCDVDTDGDVDRLDVRAITLARNTPAAGTDDPRDSDGDGTITVLDARTCVNRCTLAACAEPGPDLITVPGLVGLSQSAAEAALTGAGLTVGVVTLENSGTAPAGNVISQEPAGGSDVAPGTAVNLVVSLGEELISVPDVVGLSQSVAEATLTGAGLAIGTITTENSETVPEGDVIAQDPASGNNVTPGTAVDLIVSLGEELVAVPDVVGLSQSAAEDAITTAGLLIGSITTDNSDTVPAGDVISQSPVGGSNVAPGTAVDLVISIGEALIPTPDVVGLSQADAEIELLAVGLVLGNVTTATSDTVPAGSVISQTPLAGELVALSTTVDLVVSSGAAAEPGLIDGPADGVAADFVSQLRSAPSPLDAVGDELIFDRLVVIIESDATVAEVNDALRRHDARISTSFSRDFMFTVRIEQQPSIAALRSKLEDMQAEDAFFGVDFSRRVELAELPPFADKSDVSSFDTELSPYLPIRLPAVWNLRDRMIRRGDRSKTSILVTDDFPRLDHPELPSLTPVNDPDAREHHGLGVTGVIVANYDETGLTGVTPVTPGNPIRVFNAGVRGVHKVVIETGDSIPLEGDVLVNASWGFRDGSDVSQMELLTRAYNALQVKINNASESDRVLHVVSAGNAGRPARSDSPYAIARFFDNPCEFFIENESGFLSLDPEHMAKCEEKRARFAGDIAPFFGKALTNILVVGSARNSTERSDFSNTGYDVAAVGENIVTACADLETDVFCNPVGLSGSMDFTAPDEGTSFAAPQITGLAYVMKWLRPDVPLAIIDRLITVSAEDSASKLIDAYRAVLALDRVPDGGGDALSGLDHLNVADSVRGGLLDVRSNAGDPDSPMLDDAFTEVDLEAFIDAYLGDAITELDAEPGERNFSRFDLNGDEKTGGSEGGRFDLNNDGDLTTVTAVIGGFSFAYDETNVTDGNVLCYTTFNSNLYTGSPEYRDVVFALFGADLCVPPDHTGVIETSLEITELSLPGGWVYSFPGDPVVLDDIIPNLDPITVYRGDFRAPFGSNCFFGERGSPRHSLDGTLAGANFYIPAVTNAPYANNFGPVKDGCSNFIAFENGDAWINVTRRLDRRSSGFTFENESQMRISIPKASFSGERTSFIEYFFIGTEFAAGGPAGEIDSEFLLELKINAR